MTRSLTIAAAVLILLTGLLLGQFELLTLQSPSDLAEPNSSPRALASARAFYDGVNRLLESGDHSIETIVAPGFKEHAAAGQGDRTLPEMIDWLLALRATWPHLRIDVLDLEQQDRLIAVQLKVTPNAPSYFAAIQLATPAPRQVIEFLRVEGTAVTDRWDNGSPLPVAMLNLTARFGWDYPSVVMPAIEHLSIETGQSIQLRLFGALVLRGESGRVLVDHTGTDLDGTQRSVLDPLDAGQVRVFTDGHKQGFELRNDSSEPAELWAMSTDSIHLIEKDSDDATRTPTNPHLTFAFIPLQISSTLRDNPQRISIVRIILPPGSTVPVHVPGVIEEIAVLGGAINVTVSGGRALKCTDGTSGLPFVDMETIAAGQGFAANGTAAVSYRVVGPQPATLLIMRIDSPPSPSPL